MWSQGVYIIATVLNTFNIVTQGFFLVMYGDSETDYINPIDLCNKLNPYIVPEAILQAFIALMLLVTGHWISFLLCAPIMTYNAYIIMNNQHLLDATEIFKSLNKNKRDAFIKLLIHLMSFFYFLFHTIVTLIGWEGETI